MPSITRRGLAAAALIAPLAPAVLRAQSWPSGTIRIVAPFPPGGSVDALARLAQPVLERSLGATVIVENRAGAGGSVGANAVAKAAPDGNTWLFVFDTHAVNPTLLPNMPFDSVKDLDPVMLIGTAPMVLVTHPSQPFRTLADVIQAGKDRAGGVPYGTIGNGSLGHLAMTLLARRAASTFNHIPYRGGGPLVNDALGGHVPLSIASVAVLAAHLTAGTLRPLRPARSGLPRCPRCQPSPRADSPGSRRRPGGAFSHLPARRGRSSHVSSRRSLRLSASRRRPNSSRKRSKSNSSRAGRTS